ncbi:MAG: hypothetical protein IJ272_03305 [Clostridia bacterium]|nr:hypothetical protein [Clostridia bacterium]
MLSTTEPTVIYWGDGETTPTGIGEDLYTHTYTDEYKFEYTVFIEDDVVTKLDLRRLIKDGAISTNGELVSNQIEELDLSNASNLTELNCSYNEIETIDLSKNTKLETLDTSLNYLESLDVSENEELTSLNCARNWLETLNLSKNEKLTSLDCSENYLDTLDFSSNTNLKSLNCYFNSLEDLDLSKNKELETLNCSENYIETLDLRNNTKLTSVSCVLDNLNTLYLTDSQKELFVIKETTEANSNFVPNNELHKMPSAVIREPAPVINAVKNNDGSYRLDGINESMEYNTIDSDFNGIWKKYKAGQLQKITESDIYYVRIAAKGEKPASGVATVYVTIDGFRISVDCSNNGRISPSGNIIVQEGQTQKFLITPNSGYNGVMIHRRRSSPWQTKPPV